LSLEQIQAETRIPLAHLQAMEQGRLELVPEGPWRQGYLNLYRRRLGLDEAPVEEEPPDDTSIPTPRVRRPSVAPVQGRVPPVPLWGVRFVALGASVGLFALIAWRVLSEGAPHRAAPETGDPVAATEPVTDGPDQKVQIRALLRAKIQARVDGEVVLHRVLEPDEEVDLAGDERIEIDLPSPECARITWNGELVVPQGRQDQPRRLVFVDDVGPAD
jgi:hypothetical protein